MLTPALLLAYWITLGPVIVLPIRPSVVAPPVGFIVVPGRPIPPQWIEPIREADIRKRT